MGTIRMDGNGLHTKVVFPHVIGRGGRTGAPVFFEVLRSNSVHKGKSCFATSRARWPEARQELQHTRECPISLSSIPFFFKLPWKSRCAATATVNIDWPRTFSKFFVLPQHGHNLAAVPFLLCFSPLSLRSPLPFPLPSAPSSPFSNPHTSPLTAPSSPLTSTGTLLSATLSLLPSTLPAHSALSAEPEMKPQPTRAHSTAQFRRSAASARASSLLSRNCSASFAEAPRRGRNSGCWTGVM